MISTTTERPTGVVNLPSVSTLLRAVRRGVLLALVLLLGACSSTTFLYNRLDFVLSWYLERYVDLDREQSRTFDRQLEELLDWHRDEELPEYGALLDEMLAALDQPIDVQVVIAFSDAMEEAWYRVRNRGLDELLLLGATLSDAQIDEFIAAMHKKQRKYERKYLDRSEAEYRKDAEESLRDFLTDYLGRLEPTQVDRVQEAARALRRSDDSWLRERAEWIAVLERELARAPGWEDRIRDTVEHWEAQLDPDTLALYEHNTLIVQQALADVLDSRTQRQDRRLRRKLQSLRDDVDVLIGQRQGKDLRDSA